MASCGKDTGVSVTGLLAKEVAGPDSQVMFDQPVLGWPGSRAAGCQE